MCPDSESESAIEALRRQQRISHTAASRARLCLLDTVKKRQSSMSRHGLSSV